jgi:hypothetical protein
MRSRRLACLFLGIWIGAGLLMAWARWTNTSSVDRLLSRPAASLVVQLKALDRQEATLVLRHLTAEQNRFWLENWGALELLVGALFFFFLLFGTRQGKAGLALALLMLLIVAGQRLVLTPEIVGRGRVLDFAVAVSRRDKVPLDVLGYAYVLADLVKYGIGLILAGVLIWPHGRSLDTGQQLHMVDKTDHGHVNR